MSTETPLFTTPPTVMFVGSDAALADVCALAMPAVSLLRVGHAAGAVQRMLVTRPLVVIVDESVGVEHIQDIDDCARDICAGFVQASLLSRAELTVAITSAAIEAEQRRAREPVPPLMPEEDD